MTRYPATPAQLSLYTKLTGQRLNSDCTQRYASEMIDEAMRMSKLERSMNASKVDIYVEIEGKRVTVATGVTYIQTSPENRMIDVALRYANENSVDVTGATDAGQIPARKTKRR